ncbi:MAG TPA: hypothetical protein EYP59_18105 [Thiotrichaceae bacterium]|nr:hypothetical protein [Thiotrichaceae bacterium]
MLLNANISEDGTLVAKIPPSLWGKKVIISITSETQEESNWENISNALKKVDSLNLPSKSYDEIITNLRAFRETE